MKYLITFLLLINVAYGRQIICSPSGNDNGQGTLSSPYFNLSRAWQNVLPTDTIYMRGGTYNYIKQQYLIGKNGSEGKMIKIWAYPGEKPNLTQGSGYPSNGQDLIFFIGNWTHWRGLEISYCTKTTNADWNAFRMGGGSDNIFETFNYHHNQLSFSLRGENGKCTNNLVLNCDFYFNQDRAGDNADGLLIHYISDGTAVNTIRGCRAWNNSDDGFDGWANQGTIIYENNWSFKNGYNQQGGG